MLPGEDLDKVIHYYREAHPYYDQRCADCGREEFRLYCRAGAFLDRRTSDDGAFAAPAFHNNVKYWIKPNIENRIKSGEVKAYFHSAVKEIRFHEVVLNTPEGEVTVKNDFVFAMTGYRPDFEFMAEHGIHLDPKTSKPMTNPETLESER